MLSRVIERLEQQRRYFTGNNCRLLGDQETSFQRSCDLLAEPREWLSMKQKYRRLRAQAFLVDAFNCLSPELFFLCALALSVTDLANAHSRTDVFSVIRQWWESVQHPSSLEGTAKTLCTENSVGRAVQEIASRNRKQKVSHRGTSNQRHQSDIRSLDKNQQNDPGLFTSPPFFSSR
jgi:hypothetical protein